MPRPRPNHTHFRQGLNSKKETQLGKFELSPVKKEGLNSKSLKIFDVGVALTFEACKRAMI
jgi:hypothetical protein